MMEKVIVAKSRTATDTIICITRYGNVMASRGSVIPLFSEQIRLNQNITITDPNMTRFMMSLDDAAIWFYTLFNMAKTVIFLFRKLQQQQLRPLWKR